ncbi:LLM class flavin-dependent oxidoreductase, partial [Nocardia farcinica]|uniref:LLM class flavin-dependent oxidoreductase n=1 Tax=Nocardia farcinica TaxID=37329 RepID=UPI001145C835
MKFGLQLGYWGAAPPPHAAEVVVAAEEAGFDAVFAAESWGSDAFTPLAWWGSATERVRLGTSVVQLSARTPTATALHALTLD